MLLHYETNAELRVRTYCRQTYSNYSFYEMDVEELLDGVTNSTQAADTLSNAVKTPDLAHLKAAVLVVFFMLCRDFSRFVIPRLLEKLTSIDLANLAKVPPKKED